MTVNAAPTEEAKAAFDRIDENGEDRLTQDEFRTHNEKSFQAYDGLSKNISRPNNHPQMFMQAFEDADANGGNAPRLTIKRLLPMSEPLVSICQNIFHLTG
ncbi:MAG: hypothetical protein CBD27_09175 [Rhodospirillaceae bacterium TMED167]|nr:hypothetical protein [Rhodospirillaceae bacterium]OUW25714.1 MAG: hypothetical protein CBD27_09175 [Rhodospirillaceae bacterium TMED167]